MNNQQLISKARAWIEKGQIDAALAICQDLIQEGAATAEVYTLAAIAIIKGFRYPTSEIAKDDSDLLAEMINRGVMAANDIEDVYRMKQAIGTAYASWACENAVRALDTFSLSPSFDAWHKFGDPSAGMSSLYFMLDILPCVYNCEKYASLIDGLGDEELERLEEKYPYKISVTDNEQYKEKLYTVGTQLFDQAKTLVSKYEHATPQSMSDNARQIIDYYSLSGLLLLSSISPEKDADDNEIIYSEEEQKVICERLKTLAEAKSSELNAVFYPNGQKFSIMQSFRSSKIDEIKAIYDRIRKYEPEFIAPPLPSEEGFKIENSSQSNNSGGCYVATAVYGSYDCPEVWTLRRYRDNTLAESWYGRAFIHTYYAVSPSLVKWFGDTDWFRNMWKPKLDKMVRKLNNEGILATPYQDKIW